MDDPFIDVNKTCLLCYSDFLMKDTHMPKKYDLN